MVITRLRRLATMCGPLAVDLRAVFAGGHVADPVQAVFDAPVGRR